MAWTRRKFLETAAGVAAAGLTGCGENSVADTGVSSADGGPEDARKRSRDGGKTKGGHHAVGADGSAARDGSQAEAGACCDAQTERGADGSGDARTDASSSDSSDPPGDAPHHDQSDGSPPDAPTPACPETEDNALGPAYLPGAPVRTNLNVLGWAGTPLVISGVVRGPDCEIIDGVELDLWQANDAGSYDGSSLDPDGDASPRSEWPLRGRLFTKADGSYEFSTIYPGLYTGRTRHIHVTLRAPGYKSLTTQIYFAGVPENASDGLLEPELVINLASDEAGGLTGVFDVVLAKS